MKILLSFSEHQAIISPALKRSLRQRTHTSSASSDNVLSFTKTEIPTRIFKPGRIVGFVNNLADPGRQFTIP